MDSVTVNVGGQLIESGIKEKAKLLGTPVTSLVRLFEVGMNVHSAFGW